MNNTNDGFRVISPPGAGLARVQFLSSRATGNRGNGIFAAGPVVELLCTEAASNGPDPTPGVPTPGINQANGARMLGVGAAPGATPVASTMQVENCVMRHNERPGIHAGTVPQNSTTHVFHATLINNNLGHDGQHEQISGGTRVNVHNTISSARGAPLLFGAQTQQCSYNLSTGTDFCSTSVGSISSRPIFLDNSGLLSPNSQGVNAAIPPATPAAGLGVQLRVAQTQDIKGVSRPRPGGGWDMGAFQAPSFTPTPTRTPTSAGTPTVTRTPTPLPTFPTPCGATCFGDCNCSDTVTIDEVLTGVNIALGRLPVAACPPFSRDGQSVTVADLIAGVQSALLGCGCVASGAVAKLSDLGPVTLKIGSAAGLPGSTIHFPIEILNCAQQTVGVSFDLWFQSLAITTPSCVISPELAARGHLLTTDVPSEDTYGGYKQQRMIVADSAPGVAINQLQCPCPSMTDGAFALCTAQVLGGAPAGVHLFVGVSAAMTDVYGSTFNPVVINGALGVNTSGSLGATYVSQSVPTSMEAGQPYTVSVTMRNTGGTVWMADTLPEYALGAVNPANNTTWGINRVPLPGGTGVAQNAEKTFTWTVTAPLSAGTYNFQWRMLREQGATVTWFGDLTPNVQVTVVCGACGCV